MSSCRLRPFYGQGIWLTRLKGFHPKFLLKKMCRLVFAHVSSYITSPWNVSNISDWANETDPTTFQFRMQFFWMFFMVSKLRNKITQNYTTNFTKPAQASGNHNRSHCLTVFMPRRCPRTRCSKKSGKIASNNCEVTEGGWNNNSCGGCWGCETLEKRIETPSGKWNPRGSNYFSEDKTAWPKNCPYKSGNPCVTDLRGNLFGANFLQKNEDSVPAKVLRWKS